MKAVIASSRNNFLIADSGETEYVPRRDYYIDNTIKSMSSDDNNNINGASDNKIQRISNTTGGELVSIINNVGSISSKAPTNFFLDKNADNIFMINDGNLDYLTPSDTKLISDSRVEMVGIGAIDGIYYPDNSSTSFKAIVNKSTKTISIDPNDSFNLSIENYIGKDGGNNNYTSTVDSLLDFDYNSLDVALDQPDLVFSKDGNTYILDNKSSSDMISDMTLLIAIDTPAITGREPIAIQSSSLYSKQDINNILIDNRENKLLITEGSSMKTSQTLTSDLNTLTFITLKDENNVDINLLNNTDVVLDRVNSYSFFSSTDDLGLSVYISESFVAKKSPFIGSWKNYNGYFSR